MQKTSSPRGLRNNNPLNIKIGNDWLGEVEKNTDGVFEQFRTVEYGYRAAIIILKKYILKYGRNTINSIIDSWAPDGEPYQTNYKKRVSQIMGIGVHQAINYYDKTSMVTLIEGMATVENGCRVPREPIIKAYEMVENVL